MRTLHVWLEVPTHEIARGHLEATDGILDLSFTASSGPLREEFSRTEPGVRWHAHDMLEAETFFLARDALLHAIGSLSSRELWRGETLRTLFEVDGMSLWWHTELGEKRFRTDPLVQMIYRQWWLVHGEGAALIATLARDYDEVVVWGAEPRHLEHFGEQLRTRCGVARLVARMSSGQRLEPGDERSESVSRSAWDVGKKRLSGLRRYTALQRVWQRAREGQEISASTTDVLIVTFSSGWRRDERGQPHHTYFGDVARSLTDRGVGVTWLPIALVPGAGAKNLYQMMKEQPLPVCWDAFDVGLRDVVGLQGKIRGLQARFGECMRALLGHEQLELFGFDVSPWIVSQLEHLVDEDALKFLLLRHVVERGVELAKPSVLLYRDEFYVTGRAISSARVEGTKKWAMQHGLVSDDHWTYLNTRDELDGKLGLPCPDRFLCYGKYTLDLMTQWGYPREDIEPIGSLRHDGMITRAASEHGDPEWAKLVPGDRPVLTLCTQLVAQIPGWIERLVQGLRQADLHAHIAVKQHPFHRADELVTKTFEALEWEDYSVHVQHLEQLLRQSDAVLTENSTTGIEALIWGTPLICYREPGRYEPFPYISGGGALDGVSVEAMAESLKRVLDPTQREAILATARAFLDAHFSNMTQPALDRFERTLDHEKG